MNEKILVVDDEKDIREMLEEMLDMAGFQVALASSNLELEEKIQSFSPDLMILDIMLGDVNSADWIASHPLPNAGRRIPILFLSALLGNDSPSPAKPGNRRALRGKPFKMAEILHDIDCLLAPFRHSQAA